MSASAAGSAAIASGCRRPELSRLGTDLPGASHADPAAGAADERFWREVRRAFDHEPDLVNLNHGLGQTPRKVQQGDYFGVVLTNAVSTPAPVYARARLGPVHRRRLGEAPVAPTGRCAT